MELIVPVVKAKQTLTFDTDKIPENVYAEALRLGLKELVNRGMTKLTKAAFKDVQEDLAAAVMEVAQKNFDNILAGKIRIAGAKSDKASGKVMVEARRLAKAAVKEELKRQNIKVSYVSAKDLTEAANALIASDPSFVEKAKVNVAETEATKNEALSSIVKSVKVDEKLVKADAEKKAAAKAALSAAQAKIPAKRAQTTA